MAQPKLCPYCNEHAHTLKCLPMVERELDEAIRQLSEAQDFITGYRRELAEARAQLAEAQAQLAWMKSPAQSCKEEREAGSGGCGACAICCKELRDQLAEAQRDAEQGIHPAERERDEARAVLREVREWHRCPWKHGASVEVIDLQRHAEWIARLDAATGEK